MKYVLNKGVIKSFKTKIISFAYATVLVSASLSGAAPLLFSQRAAAMPVTTVVSPANMNGWATSQQSTSSGSFVAGPATAPLGNGSYQMTTGAGNSSGSSGSGTAGGKQFIFNSSYAGTKLTDLTALSYDTYVSQRSTGTVVAPAIDINTTINGTWTTLVFEPTYTANNTQTDQWQSWNTLNGIWWSTHDLKDSSNNVVVQAFNSYVPWSTIVALDPSATIGGDTTNNGHPVAGIQIVSGQNGNGAPWSNFVGNIDDVTINGTTYDFEPAAPPAAAPQTTQVVRPADLGVNTTDWYYYNDNTNTPTSVPLSGQYEISSSPTNSTQGALHFNSPDKMNIATAKYMGTKLSSIASMGYDSYNLGTSSAATYMQFDVSFDGSSTYQNRLVYIPANSQNAWQHNEAIQSGNGMWQWSKMITGGATAWPDGVTTPMRSWSDIVNSFPNAKILGQVLVRSEYNTQNYIDNVYLATASSNVKYDFELPAPPAAPTNLSWETSTNVVIPNGGATNVYGGTASWQASSSSDVDHYVYKYWNDITNNPYKPGSEYTVNVSGTSLPGVFNQGEGVHHFCVEAVDHEGLTSPCSATFTITYDTTAPTAPTITAPSQRQWFNTAPILNQWTAVSDLSGINHYQVAYQYDDLHTFSGSTCPGLTMGGNWAGCRDVNGTSHNHQPGLNEEGGVTIWVRAIDNAGNVGAWSQSVHYYYDHTAPSTTITVSPVVNGVFTVSGTASDNLALNRVYVQLVNRGNSQRYGGTTIDLITTPFSTNKAWSQTYDMHALGYPDGVYAADAAVVDMAGNTYDTGWTSDFTVDTTAPAAPSSANWEDSGNNVITGFTNINPIRPVWGVSSSSGVAYYEYSYMAQNYGGNVWSTPSNMGINVTTGPTYLGTLAGVEGNWQFRVRAVGTNGVDSAWTYSPIITFDRTPPVVTANNYTGQNTKPTLTGTVSDNLSGVQSVVVSINGHNYTATVSGNNWSANITNALAVGTYTASVTATDNAGNQATASATVTIQSGSIVEITNVNHVSLSSSNTQVASTGSAANNGNTNTGNANSGNASNGNVLGTNTTISNTTPSGQVKGDSTTTPNNVNLATGTSTKHIKVASNTFGLGWWWFAVLAAVIGFFWWILAAKRRRSEEEQSA